MNLKALIPLGVVIATLTSACGEDCIRTMQSSSVPIDWDECDPSKRYQSPFSPRELSEFLMVAPWRPVGSVSRDAELVDLVVEFSEPRNLVVKDANPECAKRYHKAWQFEITTSTRFESKVVHAAAIVDVTWSDSNIREDMGIGADRHPQFEFEADTGTIYAVRHGILFGFGTMELWFSKKETADGEWRGPPDPMIMAQFEPDQDG